MSATDQMNAAIAEKPPLTDAMLTIDVADTVRRAPELAQDKDAIGKLRARYLQQGIDVSDTILRDGITAAADNRFGYTPPKPSLAVGAARIYVARKRWLPRTAVLLLLLLVGLGSYYFVWGPFHAAQLEHDRLELVQTLPATMDALYQTIFTETKVQQATNDAFAIRARGKAAAEAGDRVGAEAAVAQLTTLRDTLRQEYRLLLVDREGIKWGFWTFPQSNTDETNYYLVVEAIGADGTALRLPVRNTETGVTETVTLWGLRVPEAVYRTVATDKTDNGSIGNKLVAVKQFGFLLPDYTIEVLGGAVTRW